MPYVDLVHEIPGLPGRAVWDLHRLPFVTSPERQIDVLLEQATH